MELKQKIETLLLEIFKIDTTFVSGYVEEFTKSTKPSPQTSTKPTKPGITTPGSQTTTSSVSVATGRPTTRPTLFSPGTTQATTPASKPTSSGTSNVKPTVTVSTILKFGPGVAPDPTKPLQDHLRKNLGRLSAPLNQKSLIQSVRIVHPGVPPAVLGTCTSSCLTTCVVSCNPFCCNSKKKYLNQMAIQPPRPVQLPCIPSADNICPPQMNPPVKATKVTDPPQHIIHLPPPQMQPP
ncbi:mucin-2-like isoform X2 [Orbicella faveolata]|uniref:mucin-2-like isoform X2 n=1 Tax=Orbicella faveolata TaxID=48498 RepID=UPI0009E5810B|nr:mucin-2-like isoform X2 [Orbicella faveolata]